MTALAITLAYLALPYAALAAALAWHPRRPSGRHRAPGPATTHFNIPLPSLYRDAGPVWWLNLTLPVGIPAR